MDSRRWKITDDSSLVNQGNFRDILNYRAEKTPEKPIINVF